MTGSGSRDGILLSVIVPVFNSADFLPACLESILGQTYKDLEVIAADDHSADDSRAIIEEYEGRHPRIIKGIFNSSNKGVASTRHAAMLAARGEYVTTLDSDDCYFDSGKLEAELGLVRKFREKAHKDVLAFSKVARVNEEGVLLLERGAPEGIREGDLFDCILTRRCEIPRDFVMRRALYFQVGGFDQALKMYEDWDLKLRLARLYEFVYTGIYGTAYRRHAGGLSSVPLPEHIRWLKKVFRKNLPLAHPSARDAAKKTFGEYTEDLKQIHLSRIKKEMKDHLTTATLPNPFPFLFRMLVARILC
jgi:glycosyltransferase involved in cell wall biosynthesis